MINKIFVCSCALVGKFFVWDEQCAEKEDKSEKERDKISSRIITGMFSLTAGNCFLQLSKEEKEIGEHFSLFVCLIGSSD